MKPLTLSAQNIIMDLTNHSTELGLPENGMSDWDRNSSSAGDNEKSAFGFYPRGATVAAATAAILFIITGVIGMNLEYLQYFIFQSRK